MRYEITRTNAFKKAFKKCIKRGLNIKSFETCISILSTEGKLPSTYRPHKLSGKFDNVWECHIEPDWLLLWNQDDEQLTLLLIDTGTHSDIFG